MAVLEADLAREVGVLRDRVLDVLRLGRAAVLGDHDDQHARPHSLVEWPIEWAHIRVENIRLDVKGGVAHLDLLVSSSEKREAGSLEGRDDVVLLHAPSLPARLEPDDNVGREVVDGATVKTLALIVLRSRLADGDVELGLEALLVRRLEERHLLERQAGVVREVYR